MKGYNELTKLSVFSLSDVENITKNKKTAYSLLSRLINKGLIKKIKNNVYTCVNVATGEVIASRYQIACASSKSAYISHHTAFEYYGLANQVYYEVYVSSETRFNDFDFKGVKYKFIASKINDGIIKPNNTEGIRITDLERTVIDNIKDFQKIGGLEELLNCISAIHYLNEDKLVTYLDTYNIQALYQKVGFLLQQYMQELKLSQAFIDYCKRKVGRSTRYLIRKSKDKGIYNSEWNLVVPIYLLNMIEQEGDELV